MRWKRTCTRMLSVFMMLALSVWTVDSTFAAQQEGSNGQEHSEGTEAHEGQEGHGGQEGEHGGEQVDVGALLAQVVEAQQPAQALARLAGKLELLAHLLLGVVVRGIDERHRRDVGVEVELAVELAVGAERLEARRTQR